MNEKQLQKAVIELAQRLGWRVAHFSNSQSAKGRWMTVAQGDGFGFPDLTCVRYDRLVFVELKALYRKPTQKQIAWLEDLDSVAGVETYVWGPKEWDNGTIELVLKGRKR